MRPACPRHGAGDGPAVERSGPLVREHAQRPASAGCTSLSGFEYAPPGFSGMPFGTNTASASGEELNARMLPAIRSVVVHATRHAVLGEADRRSEYILERKGPEALESQGEACHKARRCRGAEAAEIGVVADATPAEPRVAEALEQSNAPTAARGAVIVKSIASGCRPPGPIEQQDAAAAESAGRRLDYAENEHCGNRRVHGVPPSPEHGQPCRRGALVFRHHHAGGARAGLFRIRQTLVRATGTPV